jgi:DNA replication protein DnaC
MDMSSNMSLAPLSRLAPCSRCHGLRYLFAPDGERSLAVPCECLQSCAECNGTGRVLSQVDGALFTSACGCQELRRRIQLYNRAAIPRHFFSKGLESFRTYERGHENALRAVQGFLQEYPRSRKGLCLYGPPGTGKTHLLCAALQNLTLERGVPARYVEISFLYSEIREAFGRNVSALTALAPLAEVEVLAIDEIGKGKASDFEKETLEELIARRYNADRTTLCATNFNADPKPRPEPQGGYANPGVMARDAAADQHLRDRIGERAFSRLVEMVHLCQIVAKDRRVPPG